MSLASSVGGMSATLPDCGETDSPLEDQIFPGQGWEEHGMRLASLGYGLGFEHVSYLIFSSAFLFLGPSLLFCMTKGLYHDA